MNNLYVDELPKCCLVCKLGCPEEQRCVDGFTMDCDYCSVNERPDTCPLKLITDRLAEERKKVVGELKVDIRSLFDAYASSLIDYCIWNKNADSNQKLYNNFKRIINDRLVKVLDLFDKRIDQIERGGNNGNQ